MLDRLTGFFIICLLLGATHVHRVDAQTAVSQEYQIKAVFLYKLAKFVEWPENTKLNGIKLCVLGEPPFGNVLDQISEISQNSETRVLIQPVGLTEDLSSCNELYICKSERTRLPQIIDRIGSSPILSISDIEGFSGLGIIELVLRANRVSFVINLDLAKKHNLQLDPRLLQLALRVLP